MSAIPTSTVRLNATHANFASSSVPPGRRISVFSYRTASKERLLSNTSSSQHLHQESGKKARFGETPKERNVASQPIETSSLMKVTRYNQFNQTQGAVPFRKSKLRVAKIWQHPEENKFRGLWQQFEEVWFGIHSESVMPLLEDFPLPTITKSLNDLSEKIEKEEVPPESTQLPEKKKKEYQIRLLSNRLKKIEQDLIPCAHCKERKRRGTFMRCKHYFCRECLKDHVQTHIDQLKVPIKCLIPDCNHELEKAEIIKNASNSDQVMKYYDLNVSDFVRRRPHKMIQCFTDGCKHVIDLTRTRFKNQFKCPCCKIAYCIACHKVMKRGHACEDANNHEAMNGPLKQLMTTAAHH